MKKSIIAISLFIMSLFFGFTVHAGNMRVDYDNAQNLLTALGIFDGTEQSDAIVTRAEYIGYCTRLMGLENVDASTIYSKPVFTDVSVEHIHYNELMLAYSLSYIVPDPDGSFRPDAPVTINDVNLFTLNYLGYKSFMTMYPNTYADEYTKLANTLKLYKNISFQSDGIINVKTASEILYNALFLGTAEKQSSGSILENVHDTYEGSGILTADEYCTIYTGRANKNCVLINDVQLYCGAKSYHDLIGRSVRFYYRKSDASDYEIILLYEDKNSVVDILGEDTNYSDNSITYMYPDSSKTKNYKINASTSVIYNNELMSADEYKRVLTLPQARIRLIDNSNDDIYDVVIVEAAKIIEVDTYNPSTYTLTSTKGDVYKLEDYDRVLILSYYGDMINNRAVFNTGMILAVTASDTEKTLIQFRLCDKTVSAVVEGYNSSDWTITLDNKTQVPVSRASLYPITEFIIGSSYTLYYDNYGYIVFAKAEGDKSYTVGYISKIYMDETKENLFFRIFTSSGGMVEYKIKDKLKYRDVDGQFYKAGNVSKLYDELTIGGTECARQPIAYKINADNELSEFLLPAPSDRTDLIFRLINFESERDSNQSTLKYNKGDMSYGKRIQFTASTQYILVPNNSKLSSDDEDYMVKTGPDKFLRINASYNIDKTAYWPIPITMDVEGFLTDYFFFQYPPDVNRMNNMPGYSLGMIVDIKEVYNESTSDIETHIELMNNSGKLVDVKYDTTDGSGELKDLNGVAVSVGDIVLNNRDYDGDLTNGTMQLYYRHADDKFFREAVSTFTEYNTYRITKMLIGRKSNGYSLCTCLHADGTRVTEVINLSGASVMLYNASKRKLTNDGMALSLSEGDEVFMIMNGGKPTAIIKYE